VVTCVTDGRFEGTPEVLSTSPHRRTGAQQGRDGARVHMTEPRPTGRARAWPVQFTSTTVPVVIATSSEKTVGKIVRGVPPAAHNCGYSCKVRSTTVSTGAG